MGWSAQYFTTIIIEGNTPQTGIFIYNGAPSLGDLIGSWAAAAGTDAFGNVYPAGINVTQGQLQGVSIDSSTITVAQILTSTMANSTINNTQFNQGQILETTIIFDTNGGVLYGYTITTTTINQTVSGTYTFTSPIDGTASITCVGASAGGDGGNTTTGGNGGGAGECGLEPAYPVANGTVYPYVVGNGGNASVTNGGHGGDGTASTFDAGGSAGGVIGNPGLGNGTGGRGSTNSRHHNGGDGGASSPGVTGGASGGNSGNTTTPGNSGITGSGSTGGAQPAAQSGSGRGGAGGNQGLNGANGGASGGGGGGAGQSSGGTTTQTISYAPIWAQSYYGPDATNGQPNKTRSTTTMYQGGETASGGAANGNQRAVFAFNRAQIASDFSGYTITACQIQLRCLHSWFNSGMTWTLDEYAGLPGSGPSSFPSGDYIGTDASGTIAVSDGSKLFSLAASIAQRFVTGASNGLGIGETIAGSHPYNLNYYGYFDPSQTRFVITGTIGSGGTTSGTGADGRVIISYSSASVLLFALSPVAGSDANSNAYAAGYTGPANVFDPNAVPTAVEGWHNVTLKNGWTNQGFSRYKLIGYNLMLIEIQINDSSATSGVFMTMPTGYTASTSQFPTITSFANVAGTPNSAWTVQIGTGAGANVTVLDWAKQSKQFHGSIFVSLD